MKNPPKYRAILDAKASAMTNEALLEAYAEELTYVERYGTPKEEYWRSALASELTRRLTAIGFLAQPHTPP